MRVLGIETSGDLASLALADAGGIRAELAFRHELQLSRLLAPRIETLLEMAGLEVSDLEGIAVSCGPGSFTGLRIGVTAAKALAYGRGIPAAGVSTLEVIALDHPAAADALLCSVLSASAAELFAALYRWNSGVLQPVSEEMLIAAPELAARLAACPGRILIVGLPGPHRANLLSTLGDRLIGGGARDEAPRAATVALAGRERLLASPGADPHTLVPRYLRASAAEVRRATAMPPAESSA
jgi:tRNA threonylcarbamoyladenosine biosynthesis protein TsaB